MGLNGSIEGSNPSFSASAAPAAVLRPPAEGWQSGRMRRSRKPLSVVRRIEGSNPSPSVVNEEEKEAAARAAADLVEDGMRVGLGTGSTVAHLLPHLPGRRNVTYVATSLQTERAALELGLDVQPFETLDRL